MAAVALDLSGTIGTTSGTAVTSLSIGGLSFTFDPNHNSALALTLGQDDSISNTFTVTMSSSGTTGSAVAGTDGQVSGTLRCQNFVVLHIETADDNVAVTWVNASNATLACAGFLN